MLSNALAAMLLVLIGSAEASASSADPCRSPARPDTRVDLVFKSAKLTKEGRFIGTFEITNIGFDRKLSLPGRRESGAFIMDVPEVSVQFLDLNKEWVSVTTLAGDFTRPDRLEVGAKSREVFDVDLISQEEADRSGVDLRILLRFFRPDFCVISHPFRAIPPRPPVTGIEESP
jgi:hypothetical protein